MEAAATLTAAVIGVQGHIVEVEADITSGLPATALVEVGSDHRLAEPEPLKAMLQACERAE